jgi:uncharacterized PurR-regulated membrane protein YhhQ (DUF165 family)
MQEIKTKYIVALFLAAIVLANLLVSSFGQIALVFTAFYLIPFDLVARDILHDRWSRNGKAELINKIGALVIAGAVLTTLLNVNASRIAIASVVAFAVGVAANTFFYYLMSHFGREKRMVVSNSIVAVIDSTLFPFLALGLVDIRISLAQITLKCLGGWFWARIANIFNIR